MDLGIDIDSNNVGSLAGRSREPLLSSGTSPSGIAHKHVRHRHSFIRRGDSSEDSPSSNGSIYEAFYYSCNNSEESSPRIGLWPIILMQDSHEPRAQTEAGDIDENSRERESNSVNHILDNSSFLYGHGTALETITERNSNATIRTLGATMSVDNLLDPHLLSHRDTFYLAKSPRRKQSFSVDDLTFIKNSYHEACSMIERTISKPIPIHEIYANPRTPIQAPLHRPLTPPGMPSWTESQNRPQISQRSVVIQPTAVAKCFQRFFGIAQSGVSSASQAMSTESSIGGGVMSGAMRGRTAPRFRPPSSVYGQIDRHPFNNAPAARIVSFPPALVRKGVCQENAESHSTPPNRVGKRNLNQRVRFTPSATARDSEMISLQNAIESTSGSALSPMDPMHPRRPLCEPTNRTIMAKPCPHRHNYRNSTQALSGGLNHEQATSHSIDSTSLGPPSPRQGTFISSPLDPSTARSSLTGVPVSIVSSRRSSNTVNMDVNGPDAICATSVSSTANLMRGAFPPASLLSTAPETESLSHSAAESNFPPEIDEIMPRENDGKCWKCKMQNALGSMENLWGKTLSCLCLVCCGFDIDEERNIDAWDPYGVFGAG